MHEWREGRDTTLAIKASLVDAEPHPTDELHDALAEVPQAPASVVEIPDTQPMDVDDEHDGHNDAEVPESPPAEMDWMLT